MRAVAGPPSFVDIYVERASGHIPARSAMRQVVPLAWNS
jgi:hypothetical protein